MFEEKLAERKAGISDDRPWQDESGLGRISPKLENTNLPIPVTKSEQRMKKAIHS